MKPKAAKVFADITDAYSDIIDVISTHDNTIVFDFLNTDYQGEVRWLTNGQVRVYLWVFDHTTQRFIDVAMHVFSAFSVGAFENWLIERVVAMHALELATWFAGIPVVASSESESDRVIAVLGHNSVILCSGDSCQNRATHKAQIRIDSEYSSTFYACSSDYCGVLEWLKVASISELDNSVVYAERREVNVDDYLDAVLS